MSTAPFLSSKNASFISDSEPKCPPRYSQSGVCAKNVFRSAMSGNGLRIEVRRSSPTDAHPLSQVPASWRVPSASVLNFLSPNDASSTLESARACRRRLALVRATVCDPRHRRAHTSPLRGGRENKALEGKKFCGENFGEQRR